MLPYASAIPMPSCLEQLDLYYPHWRFMLSPASVSSVRKSNMHLLSERGYAIDNGAYAYHMRGQPFNRSAFIQLLDKYSHQADWIAIPDSIGNWEETIEMFMLWLPILWQYQRPLMIVAQDGSERGDFQELRAIMRKDFGLPIGVFIGGTTDWKLKHSPDIAQICNELDRTCHVGRVNSIRRTRLCHAWGVSSFDGSGMSRFTSTARRVSQEMNRLYLTQAEEENYHV